jgi:hypothetical protein
MEFVLSPGKALNSSLQTSDPRGPEIAVTNACYFYFRYALKQRGGFLIQLLCFWTLSIVLFSLFKTRFRRLYSVSVLRRKSTQLGPIDRTTVVSVSADAVHSTSSHLPEAEKESISETSFMYIKMEKMFKLYIQYT